MSTIALCIPAYNASKYLQVLLNSARYQTIPFDEILVYNDCSSDDTSEIAKMFGATVIEGDTNMGCSTGKNQLAKVAKSDWLHFHDADDDLMPNFTEVAHKWIDDSNAPDIVLMHYHYRDVINQKLLGEPDYRLEDLINDPIKFNIVNKVVNFAVIKKAPFLRIGGFNTDPEVLYNEDRAFYTKASLKGLSFNYEKELTCINYYYPGSMSAANRAKCARAALKVWEIVSDETIGKYNEDIAGQLLHNATFAATSREWNITKDSVIKAKQLFPGIMPRGSVYFRMLYKLLSFRAFFIREMLIVHFTSKRSGKM